MIVSRETTIIDYHGPFDQGLKVTVEILVVSKSPVVGLKFDFFLKKQKTELYSAFRQTFGCFTFKI